MVIDMDLFLDIVDITKRSYDFQFIKSDKSKVMVANIKEILCDLVDVCKE